MCALKINTIEKYFSEEEKAEKIYEYIDKFIVVLPEFDYFQLHKFIEKIEPNPDERKKISSINSDIRIAMQKLKLIENPPHGNAVFVLTEKGREVKNKGGYFNYLNKSKPKTDWFKIIPIFLTFIFGITSSVFLYLNYSLNTKNETYKTENQILKKENDSLKKINIILQNKK